MKAPLHEALSALASRKMLPGLEAANKWTYADVVELFRQAVNESFPATARREYPRQTARHEHVLVVRRWARERVKTMPVTPEEMASAIYTMAGRQWRSGKEAEVFFDRADQILNSYFELWCEILTLLLKKTTNLRDIKLVLEYVVRQVVNTARTAKDLDRARGFAPRVKQMQLLLLDKAIRYAADLEKRPASSIEFTHPLT